LSFAERENRRSAAGGKAKFRPQVKNKLLLLLVLLLTAATGAWATDGIACSASDIGKVLCTDGSIYATVGDATTANKTAAAMIVYIDETNMKGLALALKDESDMMSWTYASSLDGAADHKPTVTGGTWKLASQAEWNLMINAAGGYATLRDGFSAVGGDNLKSDNSYWSSTKESSSGGKEFSFASGEWGWAGNATPEYVRACLTFDIVKPAPTYTVSLNDGTEDADKWTINPNPAAAGQTVTATYSGTRRVKSVKAVKVEVIPVGAIKGKFTINNTGKQVYFAKGNLQAVCTSADNNPSSPETFTWQFAENQWDCVGNNAANNSIDGNGSVSAAGTVDLFGWSTAATTYGIHNSTSGSDYSGDFVDWGGIIGTGWRTLTKDEWNYLFMTRESGSKVNGMSPSPDNARYTHATINTDNGTGGIRGMILFPDGVTVNYSDATSWGGINQYSNWNGSTKCTTSQWNALAAKGFVFLPTGGVRNGTKISNSNNNGYYWSSYTASPTSGYAHYTRVVPTTEPTTDSDSRKIGISVRLVYEVATTDAPATGNSVDLSKLTADYEAQNGDVLTGTLAGNYKISIADGATVTLDGVTINGVNDMNYKWAGITCLGDATIILSGTNTVKGFYEDYPGIQAAAGKTLIINGTGSLTASSYGYATAIGGGSSVACGDIEIQGGTITATSGGLGAGIGGGYNASCGNITISGGTVIATGGINSAGIGGGYNASWGNITISGGTVTATGGQYGAGIGGGKRGPASFSCGNIIISGGTVTATGGDNAAGIGGGRGNNNKNFSSCGDITITTGVTEVTATKGSDATNSIGAGYYGTCGTVTIGGVEGAITTSPYTYQPSN
jgi:hypothetical protein